MSIGLRRYKENGKGYYFSPELVEWLGPKRQGDEIDDPYVDYAASIQKLLEDVSLGLIDYYLGDLLRGDRQALLRRRRGAEREAEPAHHGDARCAGAVRAAGGQRRRHRDRRRLLRRQELGESLQPMDTRLPRALLSPRPVHRGLRGARARPAYWRRSTMRRHDAARAAGRRATRWPGSRGAWSSARARWATAASSADPSPGHRRPHQRADQVPRALAPFLPEHAGYGWPRRSCRPTIPRPT